METMNLPEESIAEALQLIDLGNGFWLILQQHSEEKQQQQKVK